MEPSILHLTFLNSLVPNSIMFRWKVNQVTDMIGPYGLHFLIHYIHLLFTCRRRERFLHKFRLCIILCSYHQSIPFNLKLMIGNISTFAS